MSGINKMELFIRRGWNPEEISFEGYLEICDKLNKLYTKLQESALESDEKYESTLPQIEEKIESLLKDFELDSSEKADQ